MSPDTLSSIATAIGIAIATWQIWQNRRLGQTEFEDSIDQQYRDIVMKIPVDALIGKKIRDHKKECAREVIYNYLDLCNEQVYLRNEHRICKSRWEDWSQGIKSNLEKPVFREVFEEVKRESKGEFSWLNKLEASGFDEDPASWKKGKI